MTVAAVLDGRLDPMTGVGYVVSQLIGGIARLRGRPDDVSQAAVAEHGDAARATASINDIQAVIIETRVHGVLPRW